MYCKAITKKGTICLNSALDKCNHCNIHNKNYDVCTICYDNIYDKVVLDCGHEFCSNCIFDWKYTEERNSCPCCRSTINEKLLHKRNIKYIRDVNYISNKINILHLSLHNDEDIIHFIHGVIDKIISNRDLLRCKIMNTIMLKKIKEFANNGLKANNYLKFFESANEKYCA